jgi:hypothetical protein
MKAVLHIAITSAMLARPPAHPRFDEFEVATIKPTPLDWTGGRYLRMQTAHGVTMAQTRCAISVHGEELLAAGDSGGGF